jgi:hypothetical protein
MRRKMVEKKLAEGVGHGDAGPRSAAIAPGLYVKSSRRSRSGDGCADFPRTIVEAGATLKIGLT